MRKVAAIQIGISKRFIVFAVPNSPKVIKSRADFDISQVMPKTIWINPSYVPITEERRADIEGCFSVPDVVGSVW
ncbi:MAG: hypothetical protein EOP33_00935 [Rickettsiaceae bacterium]|nr:MAG: hypothetical protein EOP33_00935 [Rickettsiaceae bacterium]